MTASTTGLTPSRGRRGLLGTSVAVHAALAVALIIGGLWRLERLEPPRTAFDLAVMAPPPPPPEGGHAAAPRPALTPRPRKRIVHDTQPAPRSPEVAPESSTTASSATQADGEGEGDGDGDGRSRGPGIVDGVTCLQGACDPPAAACGDRAVDPGETCDDGNQRDGDGCSASCQVELARPTIVAPTVLGALRISGQTQIVPPDPVKTAMLRDGRTRTLGVLKVCIDRAGQVASVAIAASTRYAPYDALLVGGVRGWRYRPHLVDGQPTPACGMVTFVYTIR